MAALHCHTWLAVIKGDPLGPCRAAPCDVAQRHPPGAVEGAHPTGPPEVAAERHLGAYPAHGTKMGAWCMQIYERQRLLCGDRACLLGKDIALLILVYLHQGVAISAASHSQPTGALMAQGKLNSSATFAMSCSSPVHPRLHPYIHRAT